MPGIRVPDCCKFNINQNMARTSQFARMASSSIFFWVCFVSLVKFSYWSKFHINITTGSRVMTNYLFKGLLRNPEIGNTAVWISPNVWRLGQARDTKFGTHVPNELLVNDAKCQGYSCYHFRVNKRKATGWIKLLPLPPTHTYTHAQADRNTHTHTHTHIHTHTHTLILGLNSL